MLSWYYPIPSASIPKQTILFWLIPLIFFIPYILFNPSFIHGVERVGTALKESYGPAYFVFPLFVLGYVTWSLKNLISKLKFVEGRQLRDTRLFIWAFILAVLSGLVFDVMVPATGRPRVPIGIYSSVIIYGLSAYIMAKK
jgi:hypothetical protein